MKTVEKVRSAVRAYYGDVLGGTEDLQTSACCTAESVAPHIKRILDEVDGEILARFYGCGSPIPPALEGRRVLDLGCGTGRDAYVCAKLVGPNGLVIGVDMTEEQIAVARRHERAQANRFGFVHPNTRFVQGAMEDLRALDIADGAVDVVISNCVINLSPDKSRVFSEIFRVLKPGGELFFSDVFADRRLPAEWMQDQTLLGECLAGAMYVEDFRRLMLALGVPDHRVVSQRPIEIESAEVAAKVGAVRFSSVTVRAFKVASLEDRCEDYGQVATYRGTIAESPHSFVLDDHHELVAHKPMLVCGNTAAMLAETRFAPHFEVRGDRSRHFGLFPCDSRASRDDDASPACC